MARSVIYTKTLVAGVANAVCLSQTPLAAGNLTINGANASGGVATLATQRRILITPAGADVARTFTVYGTNDSGAPISEAVTGANNPSTSATTLDFKTVTRVAVDAATAGAITVGTNGVGSTPWYCVDTNLQPMNIGVQAVISGTVNADIEYTLDDPNGATVPTVFDSSLMNAMVATTSGSVSSPVSAVRQTTNSGTGTVTTTFIQAGLASP